MTGSDIKNGIVKWFDDPDMLTRINQQRGSEDYSYLAKGFRWGMSNDGVIMIQVIEIDSDAIGVEYSQGWDNLSDMSWHILDGLTAKDLAKVVKEFEKLVVLL